MFENQTFEAIRDRMLERVPEDVDKLEGSVIYDAVAPAAIELANLYADLGIILRQIYADTADGDNLTSRLAEFGVYRDLATFAIRKAMFTDSNNHLLDVPINSRFRLNDVVYAVTDRISQGVFKVKAETAGAVGNKDFGDLLPVEPIEGLGKAILTDVLIAGKDEETDDSLYKKYIERINEQAFGGNRADYKEKITSIDGVGGVKLFRALNGGGTVGAIIIGADYDVPSPPLIEIIQTAIDPVMNQGDGIGIAPIGHSVSVSGVGVETINIETNLVISGVTISQIESTVQRAIDDYLLSLRKTWADQSNLIVRISQMEAKILSIEGVQDINNTMINGVAANLELTNTQIPVLGSVFLNG